MAFLLYVIEPRFIKFKDVSSMWTKICSFVFGCLSLISIIILFVISLRLIYLDKSVLENPLIIRKFGVLYDNLKTSKRIYLVYVSLFIYRRSFMAIIYLFLSGSNHWQILYTIYQNFALSMFVGFNKPFKIKSDYFREYVNEWFIMTLTFNLILFSDFILDQEFKYDVAGWGYVYMIGICVAFNLTYLIKAMFN